MMLRPRSRQSEREADEKATGEVNDRVPQGNLVPKSWAASNDTPYRESAPMLPPAITKSIFMVQPSNLKSLLTRLKVKSLRAFRPVEEVKGTVGQGLAFSRL